MHCIKMFLNSAEHQTVAVYHLGILIMAFLQYVD